MEWAYGLDGNGREIGYGVEATCDEPGCEERIDRGLYFRCGPCGRFFCGRHLFFGQDGGFCGTCSDDLEKAMLGSKP